MRLTPKTISTSIAPRLQALAPEAGALIAWRTTIRALPLLSLYSEGTNKKFFPIPPFGFLATDHRAGQLTEFFYAQVLLLQLIHKKLPDEASLVYHQTQLLQALDAAEDAYLNEQRDGISFASFERKMAFLDAHRIAGFVFNAARLPYEWLEWNHINHRHLVSELTAELSTTLHRLRQSLAEFIDRIAQLTPDDIVESQRNDLVERATAAAHRKANRMDFLATTIRAQADSVMLQELADNASKAANLYQQLHDDLIARDLLRVNRTLDHITAAMNTYEESRINTLPLCAHINVDLYQDATDDLLPLFLQVFDQGYAQRLQHNLTLIISGSQALLDEIATNEPSVQKIPVVNALAECFTESLGELIRESLVNEFDLGTWAIDDVELLIHKTRQINELDNVEHAAEFSCFSPAMVADMADWLELFFTLAKTDVKAYSPWNASGLFTLFYDELLHDLDVVTTAGCNRLLTRGIWSTHASNAELREWQTLWEIFWSDATSLDEQLATWRNGYELCLIGNVTELMKWPYTATPVFMESAYAP
jgi:hypothetical protein